MDFLDLAKQVMLDNIILQQTNADILKEIEEEEKRKEIDKKLNELTKNKAEDENGVFVVNKFTLRKEINKLSYAKLKGLSEINPIVYLTNEVLHKQLDDSFTSFFKEILYFGEEKDVLMLADLKEQLEISRTFVELMESRLRDLKKKLK
jgi:hypothetical protein